ncbi:clathrin interactor EPSIN 2-like [Lactuca sativa]|uniref:clathrin interactor EPSIN 2-like n=1 Tax=Lactuca sativa TaxID=4236 RepID=UPI0022AE97C5|nr:clathrin interactor EPSIN 2-like [Lactuca sativa]
MVIWVLELKDASLDGRGLEPKLSRQNDGGPPSYEDAVSDGHSPVDTKRTGETAKSSPEVNINHQEIPAAAAPPPPAAAATPPPVTTTPPPPAVTINNENDGFDFFDPRGAAPAPSLALAPQGSGSGEMEDLFGSLSKSFSSSNALALATSTSSITTKVHPPANTNPYLTFDTSSTSRAFDDPFGDGPFKFVPSTDGFSA